MELFSISCTTCKTRLKVRDEGAIGKLLDCPKCGAFVLVEPPTGWQSDQARGNGKSTPESAGHTLPSGPAPSFAPPPPPAESTFDDAASLLSDAPVAREATFAAAAPSSVALPEPPVTEPPAGDQLPHEAARESAEIASELAAPAGSLAPQWLLMGVAAVGGVALALGLFVVAVWIFSGGKQPVVAAGPGEQNSGVAAVPGKEPATDKVATKPVEPADTTNTKEPSTGPDKIKPAVDPFAGKPGIEPKEPGTPTEPVKPKEPGTIPDPPKEGVSAEPKPAEPVDPKTVSRTIDKFSKFLDDPASATPDTAEEEPAAKPVTPEPVAAVPTEELARPRPEPRKVDVAARLADKLTLEFQAVPLVDFAQFISDFSTIPVTLDPEALQSASATPGKPISVKLRDASVGTILKEALTPLGLAFEITPAGLVVGRPAPADGKLRSTPYSVADLGGDDAERLAGLSELALALVAPESWEPAGGVGTLTQSAEKQALVVQQSEVVHFQMVLFFEKLRVARGLSPRSKFDKSLFRLDPRASRAASKLNTPITLNFSQPAPLVRILDRLGKTAGVRILVDWQAAATVGWSPDAEGTVVADKLSLADTLTALLRPMDLTYRIVDDNLLLVTTTRALEARLELEFHPVADLLSDKLDGPSLVERVKASLGDELFPEAGPGGAIRFDVPGKCLLVSLPQPKQAELAKLLAEWRGAK